MAFNLLVPIAKVLGLTSAGILSGMAISSSSVTVAVILETAPDSFLAKQWSALYKIGAAIAPPYAATCSLCFAFLASQATTAGFFPHLAFDPTSPLALYTAAAVSIPSIVPFTEIVMKATNDRLKQTAENSDITSAAETRRLIREWSAYNFVRVGLITAGALFAAVAVVVY